MQKRPDDDENMPEFLDLPVVPTEWDTGDRGNVLLVSKVYGFGGWVFVEALVAISDEEMRTSAAEQPEWEDCDDASPGEGWYRVEIYSLPESLWEWAFFTIRQQVEFPCHVEFGILDGRAYAEFLD